MARNLSCIGARPGPGGAETGTEFHPPPIVAGPGRGPDSELFTSAGDHKTMTSLEPQAREAENPEAVVRQIAGLAEKAFPPLRIEVNPLGAEFASKPLENAGRPGVQAVQGALADGGVVIVKLELVRAHEGARVNAALFFRHLAGLGERARLIPPVGDSTTGTRSLWTELRVHGSLMSFTRECAFLDELRKIDELAVALLKDVPSEINDERIQKLYRGLDEYLVPVLPWEREPAETDDPIAAWGRETRDLLLSGGSIAFESPCTILEAYGLSVIAAALREQGGTLGRAISTAIPCRGILELAGKAPGPIAVPAIRISLGSNPYELNNEAQALLAGLSSAGLPTVFTGTFEQLQSVFHGGQGSVCDPLLPIVRRLPPVTIPEIVRYAVWEAARKAGGVPPAAQAELAGVLLASIDRRPMADAHRLLPFAANRLVRAWSKGHPLPPAGADAFVATIGNLAETFAGLGNRPRVARSPEVQTHHVRAFTDPVLLDYLKEHLLGQDAALEQLVSRLRMEALSRPAHQPIRYCAQGTPGTGKSESAVLLARRLEIPFINIDAASMSDPHTASSQLLGSGRGIVGSHQSGRLERAAKHHRGVVVEVSDLDHATPPVRAALADLFLQVLETGEAQSAMGAMFSCANLILAFTMNLPGGRDEALRTQIGFCNTPTRRDVNRQVAAEIQRTLSGAFLSRVGTPIVFDPLDGDALARILERAIRATLLDAAERLGAGVGDVVLEPGLGFHVLDRLESRLISYGARALLEHGRSLATDAFMEWIRADRASAPPALLAVWDESRGLVLYSQKDRS